MMNKNYFTLGYIYLIFIDNMLNFDHIKYYYFHNIICDFLYYYDVLKIGKDYLFNNYKPFIKIDHKKKFIFINNGTLDELTLFIQKPLFMNWLNKWKRGFLSLMLFNDDYKWIINLENIKSERITIYSKKIYVTKFPKNCYVSFHGHDSIIDFNSLSEVKELDLVNGICKNLCSLDVTDLEITYPTYKTNSFLKYFPKLENIRINNDYNPLKPTNVIYSNYIPPKLTSMMLAINDLNEIFENEKCSIFKNHLCNNITSLILATHLESSLYLASQNIETYNLKTYNFIWCLRNIKCESFELFSVYRDFFTEFLPIYIKHLSINIFETDFLKKKINIAKIIKYCNYLNWLTITVYTDDSDFDYCYIKDIKCIELKSREEIINFIN
jgi:hypothetical protein